MKKRNFKKYLFAPIVLLSPFALIACKVESNKAGDKTQIQLNESLNADQIREKLNSIEDFDFVQFDQYQSKKRDLKPSDIISYVDVIAKPQDASLRDKVKVEVSEIKEVNDRDGELTFNLKLSYNETSINKDIRVSGFKKYVSNIIDLRHEERFAPNSNKLQDYINSDLYSQFKLDNQKYLDNFLKRYIDYATDKKPENWRKDIARDSEFIEEYNKLAEKLHLDDFNSALYKGFALPQNEDGKKKLSLYEGTEVAKAPGWSDIAGRDVNKAYGVPRILPNDTYRKYALDTYSVSFQWPDEKKNKEEKTLNKYLRQAHGTMWTMDFAKEEGKSYPTKWYFGTNMHVADAFNNNVISLSLSNIKDSVGINTKLPLLGGDRYADFFNSYYINGDIKDAVNVIFEAKDFLDISPANYLIKSQRDKYKDYQEMLDFAIIEIDFEKLIKSKPNEFPNAESWAKKITHDYANQSDRHVKFLSETYLKNYDKAKFSLDTEIAKKEKKDNFYIIGYPISTNDWGLDRYEDKDFDPKTRPYKQSLWINGESSFFNAKNIKINPDKNNLTTQEFRQLNGDRFSSNLGFRTFADKPGLLDAFIGFPKISNQEKNQFYTKNNSDGTKSYFINFGLEYSPRHFSPEPGASGSVIRNQKNELVGVFHSKNGATNSGLAAAFRSEGYDYEGLYGDYKLPQYDLIYGGATGQKNSYLDELKKKYTGSFKTNLFKNGFTIPEEFKFNK
ncbi:Ig-specific serine endopeptidase MIP [[Mycoplasma] phocidae]|nr:lipoprotein 17-related variable surface protein [[Mycoplasma] phocae]